MDRLNKENLEELFEKFGSPKEAKAAAEDVYEGERILAETATPEPDGGLIASIKTRVDETISQRTEIALRYRVYKTIAVAAVFILITGIGIKLFEEEDIVPKVIPAVSIMADSIWESEYLFEDDEHLSTLAAEIEQIENDLITIQLGENGGNGGGLLTELEMEFMEINGDFWKG